jgi:hypothetical protein
MRTGKPAKPRGGTRAALDPATAGEIAYVDYLRQTLTQLEQAALDASSAGSWQAVASIKMRAMESRRLLDEEIAKASSPDASMSDDQLLSIIVAAVASMPPQHLERIEDAVELRRSGKVVRMTSGGGA